MMVADHMVFVTALLSIVLRGMEPLCVLTLVTTILVLKSTAATSWTRDEFLRMSLWTAS